MAQDYTFQGWLGLDANSAAGHMVWGSFEPKPWEETDVDIKITHSSICGSDIHTLSSGWGPTNYPCVVGHEIVGTVVRAGSQVQHLKVGDRVGVGAQSDSCRNRQRECRECSDGLENMCSNPGRTDTYNATFLNKGKAYGGYATYNRCPAHFAIPIPAALDSADASPMLCGGITTYAPLKNNHCGPGKRVGIIGVGGLGHFGVLWAKALGADYVVGISRRESKRADVLALGADAYIATEDDEDWAKTHAKTLDIIVCTVSSHKMPLRLYLGLLRARGIFVQVGAPEDLLPPIAAFDLLPLEKKIGGSGIGPPGQIREMLELAAEKGVKPWIETRRMEEANQAVVDMAAGKARYRYTLVN